MNASRLLTFAACGLAGFFGTNAMVAHRSAGPETLPAPPPTAVVAEMPMPSITESALVAEWEEMRSQYGRDPADLPTVYLAVKETKDAFRRRAFRAALLAEWAVTDPRAALAFLREKDSGSVSQFLREWLRFDPQNAITTMLADEKSKENLRGLLGDIAKVAPARLVEVVGVLPKAESRWDSTAKDAFAIFARKDPNAARAAAESVHGALRGQVLAGVAGVLAETDGPAALAWAQALPAGEARDETLKSVLTGWAKTDPVAALQRIDLVPPGGEENYHASDVGAQVLREAAKRDWDGTIQWLRDHPGKLGRSSLDGLQDVMSKRLNTDPAGTLRSMSQSGLPGLDNVLANSLLNDGYAQRDAIWQWLDTQPPGAFTKSARGWVLNAIAWKEPDTALEWIEKIPDTPENKEIIERGTLSLLNGGSQMDRFESFLEKASPKMRASLIAAGFSVGREALSRDPALWIGRINDLPPERRSDAISGLAGSWAAEDPAAAIVWVEALPSEIERSSALRAAIGGWAQNDPVEAAQWLNTQPNGLNRDIGASGLVSALINSAPEDAWTWAQSIGDPNRRLSALQLAQMGLRMKDPAIAKQMLESAKLTPAEVQALTRPANAQPRTAP